MVLTKNDIIDKIENILDEREFPIEIDSEERDWLINRTYSSLITRRAPGPNPYGYNPYYNEFPLISKKFSDLSSKWFLDNVKILDEIPDWDVITKMYDE